MRKPDSFEEYVSTSYKNGEFDTPEPRGVAERVEEGDALVVQRKLGESVVTETLIGDLFITRMEGPDGNITVNEHPAGYVLIQEEGVPARIVGPEGTEDLSQPDGGIALSELTRPVDEDVERAKRKMEGEE